MLNDGTVLERLDRIFQNVLDDDEVHLTQDTTARDVPGWDSLAHVRLMLTVEKDFRVKFSAMEIGRLNTVGDLVALVQSKLAGR